MIPHRIGLGLGIQSVPAIVGGGLAGGWPAWVYPHASLLADLDFLNQRYAWAGLPRVQGDFDGWTGVTHTAGEGVTTAAVRGISLAKSKFTASDTLTVAASTTGIATPAGNSIIAEIWDNSANESIRLYLAVANWTRQVRKANVQQAAYTKAIDAGVKHALSIANKDGTSFRSSFDGVSSTPTTTGAACGPLTALVIGNAEAYTRRVVVLGAAASDAEHAALTTWLLANA